MRSVVEQLDVFRCSSQLHNRPPDLKALANGGVCNDETRPVISIGSHVIELAGTPCVRWSNGKSCPSRWMER